MLISDLIYYTENYSDIIKVEISVNKHDFEIILPQARKLGYKLYSPAKITPYSKIKIAENITVFNDGDDRFSNGYVGYDIILNSDTSINGYLTGFVVEVLTENERAIKTLLE